MDRDRLIFCPDLATDLTTQVIAKELAANVFGDSGFAELLKARYKQMGDLYKNAHYNCEGWNLTDFGCENCATRNKKDARLKVPRGKINCNGNNANVTRLFDCDNFGHDMPVWVSYNQDHNAKRVMIVSQDPLRGSKTARGDNDEKGFLYLSTPFGVHSCDFESGGMDTQVKRMLDAFLDKGFCVYLTDNMKFYATHTNEKGQNKNVIGWGRRDNEGYKERFSTVIAAEIERFNPQLIITLGVKARGEEWTDSILSSVRHPREGMCPKSIECVGTNRTRVTRYAMSLVHPSRANQWIVEWQLNPGGADGVDCYFKKAIETAINQLQSLN